jgi:hypothetical protein
MYLVGAHNQTLKHHMYDASGTITAGTTPQLVLPRVNSRAMLLFVNNSTANMLLEIGGARATAALTSGVVTSVSVTNAGFNYSLAPSVTFYSGGPQNPANSNFLGPIPPTPDFQSPGSTAEAHCVMTGSAPNMSIASIVIDNGGSGYLYPPYVFIGNNENDPNGCAVPSATVGALIVANGGNYVANGTTCTTDAISVYCATTSSAFTCKFMI